MQVFDIPIGRDQQETTPHGQPGFPLALYRTVLSRNVLGFVNWHWHTELQFCLATRGEVVFSTQEGQHTLPPGEGIFISSGQLHMAKALDQPDSEYICLDFSPKLLSSFSGSVFESRYLLPYLGAPQLAVRPLSPREPRQQEILAAIQEVETLCAAASFGYELRVLSLLNRMWLALIQDCPAPKTRSAKDQGTAVVQTILAYLDAHYAEHLTMEQIAQAVSFSPSECCRIFKRLTRETIFSYLQGYRITRAAQLLGETDLPISQVAYDTGFCSTSYFIQVFRQRLGLTPLQYRKGGKERSALI